MPSPFDSNVFSHPLLKKPPWPARMGLLTALAVAIVPLLVTLLLALVIGLGVYAAATLIARLLGILGIDLEPKSNSTASPTPRT